MVTPPAYDQNPSVQEQPLRDLLVQREWKLNKVYTDRASGAKEGRPGLDDLMADARRGAFNVVVVRRFDRFARSVKQLVLALEEFRSLGIDFVSHQEALDTSTPMGKAIFTIIAAMAELERNVIRDGLRRAWNMRGSTAPSPGRLSAGPDSFSTEGAPSNSAGKARAGVTSPASYGLTSPQSGEPAGRTRLRRQLCHMGCASMATASGESTRATIAFRQGGP